MNQDSEQRKVTKRAPSLQKDGKRKSIFPKRLQGKYSKQRRSIAVILMIVYLATPWIQIDGRWLLKLNFSTDTFWVLFSVWHQSDSIYFLTVPLLLVMTIFLATAVKGRIWCGYACPQTVFLDWLIRPLEEFFEGDAYTRKNQNGKPLPTNLKVRICLKHLTYLVLGSLVGNTALMYFNEPKKVLGWMQQYPIENPSSFVLMAVITLLFYLDFAWFREQFCSFVCPYARFQAILLDEHSPVVHYHADRGEPRSRAKIKKKETGDCINCGLCTRVCPTGIDIRDGLQLECIQCMRCVDACNMVMTSLKRPTNLIEFTGAKKKSHGIRGRVAIYLAIIAILLTAVAHGLFNREPIESTLTRQYGTTFSTFENGKRANFFQLRLTNTTGKKLRVSIVPLDPSVELICGICSKEFDGFETKKSNFIPKFPADFSKNQIMFETKVLVVKPTETKEIFNSTLTVPIIQSPGGRDALSP